MLNVVDDIEQFGAPRNFNAERPESLLIKPPKDLGVVLKSNMWVACMNYYPSNANNDDLSDSDDEDDNSDTDSEILQTAGQAMFATVTCVFGVSQANAH